MTIKAKATVHEGLILIRTTSAFGGDEFEKAKDLCKSIPGARWKAAHKAWSYPLAVDVCLAARKAFGDQLTILDPLADWFREASSAAQGQATLSHATDAELRLVPTVAPRLFATLRADQRAGTAWVSTGHRSAGLVADQPGCGKTLVTIAGIIESGATGPILVACPRLSVKAVWFHELRKWTDERVYMARGTRAKRQRVIDRFMADPAERKWLIVVSEMLRVKEAPREDDPSKKKFVGYEYPALFESPWSFAVVDESHKMFGSLTVVKGNLAGKGLKRLPCFRRLAVTGTPFGKGGRVQGMFGTLMWLWPDEFTSFWRWAETHFVIEEEEIYIPGGRGRTRTVKNLVGLKGGLDEEQFLHTLGPRILRRTKAEVLPWLPPKQWVDVWCEMSPGQERQYKTMVDDGEVVTHGGVLSIDGVLAAITRGKQLANGVITVELGAFANRVAFTDESCKLDMLWEKLDARGILDDSGDTKVIIASQFNQFLTAVENRLKTDKVGYHLMTGSTSDTKRDKMMDTFQADGGHRVFLLNSKAGGVSVTLDAADEVHALDEMWDPGDNEQLEDRVHRASRNHQVTIYRYLTEGTIDETINADVEGRRFDQFRALDGRRGLEYVRNLTQYRKPKEEEMP